MKKGELRAEGITSLEKGESRTEGITSLFKVLSKPDALKLFRHTGDGIKNSTYAIDELDLTPKRYYARLRELVEIGLVRKQDSGYEQTALGRMIYDRFLPAMGKAYEVRDELELIVGLEGIEMKNGVRKSILEELGIPIFEDSTKFSLLGDYEALVVELIDLCNEAEENILLASNYFDVRVMEATFRSMNRGVNNRLIMGKKRLSSKIQQLKMILSPAFTLTIIKSVSDVTKLGELSRVLDLPYSFCIVDGQRSIIEISNIVDEKFIAALLVDNRGIAEKLTEFYESLWKVGDINSDIKVIDLLKNA